MREAQDMHSDTVYRDKVLYSMDPYDKLDALNFISSIDILREIYKGTDDLFVKKEIIRICKDNRIYQLALNERNEILKIAVIKAIYYDLQSKWNLEEKDKENDNAIKAKKPRKYVRKKSLCCENEEKETKEPVHEEEWVAIIEYEIEEQSSNSTIVECDDGCIPATVDAVVVEDIQENQENQEIQEIVVEPSASIEAIECPPTFVIATTENEDMFACCETHQNEEKHEQKKDDLAEISNIPVAPALTKQAISKIFNMYTLVDLLRSSPPEHHDDIHAQIKRVLDSQKVLEALDKM
jgi:hypothetical protein